VTSAGQIKENGNPEIRQQDLQCEAKVGIIVFEKLSQFESGLLTRGNFLN